MTLQEVDSLLIRICDKNGVPCDSEEGVSEEVGFCEALHGIEICSAELQFVDHESQGSLRTGEPRLCLEYAR